MLFLTINKLFFFKRSFLFQFLETQSQNRAGVYTSTTSVTSHRASANAPADFIFQALREDLHTRCKCFTGAQLVEWVENYVRENGLEKFGACIGSSETHPGVELGQMFYYYYYLFTFQKLINNS